MRVIEFIDRDHILANELFATPVSFFDLLEDLAAYFANFKLCKFKLGTAIGPSGEEFAIIRRVELFEVGTNALELGGV